MSIVIGIDGGLAHMGVCVFRLGYPTSITPSMRADGVLRLAVFATEKSEKKLAVRASEDTVLRARLLAGNLRSLLSTLDELGGAQAVCMETLSLPRNAGSSAKIGVALGVAVAIFDGLGLPIVQASPVLVKKAVCGKGSANKDEVIAAVRRLHPETVEAIDDMRKGDREHAADAVAIVRACLDADVIRLLRGRA